MTNDIAVTEQPVSPYAIMPVVDLKSAAVRRQALIEYTAAMMVKGRDFGTIPGAGPKPTLLKPGAEKLASFFGLSPQFETVDQEMDWTGADHDGEPFFFIRQRCTLTRGDLVVGQGIGSCNSWEKKYRWRNGQKNPNAADLVNTIDKMAQKRALVAAVLIAVNASEFFTQDIEDYGDIVDGSWTPAPAAPAAPKAAKPEPIRETYVATVPIAGPLPDDELAIREADARAFVTTAAALLETDTDTLKARLHALGYQAIPGKATERVVVYRKLRADLGAADDIMQPALVTVAPDTANGGGAYQD